MSSERGGLLKERAEMFARHLQTRLSSLGTDEDTSWNGEVTSDSEVYYDLESPEEEATEPIFISQNRNSLALQRSESDGSQYFDSLEEWPATPPPVQLTEDCTNGYTNFVDDDSGCSRVHESSFSGSVDDTDSHVHSFVENNNTRKGAPEMFTDMEACVVNSIEVEIDTRQNSQTSDSFCVFCDIEQIKSNLSNNHEAQEEVMINGQCEETGLEDTEHLSKDELLSDEESIPLSDLLKVLKQEMALEEDEPQEADSETLTSVTPSIEVRESSPDTQVEEAEEEVYDIETKRKNFRRCSSLKTGKTPPGTPGRKKIVRFADVLGLDLADVKTFLDEVPTVPKSAFEDLHDIEVFPSSAVLESLTTGLTVLVPQVQKTLVPLFQQPSIQPNFLDRVRDQNVCLESAYVSDAAMFAVSGVVRVKNIDFHKSVHVRYSIDRWRTYSDLQARYVSNSCDGFSDKFSFVLYAHTLAVGQRLEFAVRFHTAGAQFWDSNAGRNYCFECSSSESPALTPHRSGDPIASFY